jgi:NADH:ubiquinone oxidoreductase subunit 6 (subunit J)
LFREYVVGFEVTSLLLLAAIIGAILLAKRRV